MDIEVKAKPTKPLGRKSYGHIPHLPNSRMGPADHACHEGQARIATAMLRDKWDYVIVQEKLDGSNVGVAKIGKDIIALGRSGYEASTSPYVQHRLFAEWVKLNDWRFDDILRDGERLCGEWLAQAHGTRYELRHEPFVAFDLMRGTERATWADLQARVGHEFVLPRVIHEGAPLSVGAALHALSRSGHGAIDPVEGAVWRVERNELNPRTKERAWKVDFLVKYVRPDKIDGCYLPEKHGGKSVWNCWPEGWLEEFKAEDEETVRLKERLANAAV